jgi:AcrR family transcriptional regulator
MGAIVEVVAERGYAGASVGLVVERAGISRRTFYELFPGGLDDGLIAVMDWALARMSELVSRRIQEGSSWQDGGLRALAALLLFFDADRALAQVSFMETMAGAAVREHRERNVRTLRALIVAQFAQVGMQVQPLAAEAVMASLMGMIYAHLASCRQTPLIELLGSLMSAAVMPFVPGEQAALREKLRGEELARSIQAGDPEWILPVEMTLWSARSATAGAAREGSAGASLPAVLVNPGARRARECLLYVAEHPDSSNAEIAAGIGVAHRSQISRLLSELAGEELIVRRSEGVGKRNAWRLSQRGKKITRKL